MNSAPTATTITMHTHLIAHQLTCTNFQDEYSREVAQKGSSSRCSATRGTPDSLAATFRASTKGSHTVFDHAHKRTEGKSSEDRREVKSKSNSSCQQGTHISLGAHDGRPAHVCQHHVGDDLHEDGAPKQDLSPEQTQTQRGVRSRHARLCYNIECAKKSSFSPTALYRY